MQITTYQAVGPIRFGINITEVREALGAEFESFKRSSAAANLTDHFFKHGCFVYYSDEGLVDAVEFAEPARPMLDDLNLFGVGFAELIEKIKQIDPQLLIESDGFTSLRLGIGGWAPTASDEPGAPLASAIAFARGYYD